MIEQFYEREQRQEQSTDQLDPWSSTGDVDRLSYCVPPSFAVTVDKRFPRDLASTTDARAWVLRRKPAWRMRRGTLVIVATAVLAATGMGYYYNHRQRSFDLDYVPHRLAANNEQDSRDSSAGDSHADMPPLGTSPARDIKSVGTEKNTAVRDAERLNNFSNNAEYRNIAPRARSAVDTTESAAAPAPEPAAAATAETRISAPAPTKSEAAPASPPRGITTTAPISWYEVEAASAPADIPAAAIVSFAIAPWGEIYVDGDKRGVSPPLRELGLTPGQHKIEVRNTTFPTYVRTIDIEAGAQIRIKHHFP